MNAPAARRRTSPALGAWIMFLRIAAVYRNTPALFAVTLAAPLGMMLLFGFVFGGALSGGQDAAAYRAYLTPGVLVLVAATGLVATAMTANTDLHTGLTDRIRALPVHPIAPPAGMALAEAVTGSLALLAMSAAGYAVGWRIDGSAGDIALAVALLLAFRYAVAWLGIVLGSAIRDQQILQQIAPLVFGTIMFSDIFVPTSTMPAVVAAVAEWNPVSAVVAALRRLLGSATPVTPDSAWPMHHPVAAAFGWTAILLAVSVPTALRHYSSTR